MKQIMQSKDFKRIVSRSATSLLEEWVGKERAAEATGRIAAAFAAAALASRDPSALYTCTPESVALAVAISALTGLMPGTGPSALAYLVPRATRKGEPPQAHYQLSHRGIAVLAKRGGSLLFANPVGWDDELVVADGEVTEHDPDIDEPPMKWEELRGISVIVKDLAGHTIYRGWVPRKIIEARRKLSESFRWAEQKGDWARERSMWHQWPIEMAMKTALHYAVARAWVVVDDSDSARALSLDVQSDSAIDGLSRRIADPQERPPYPAERLETEIPGFVEAVRDGRMEPEKILDVLERRYELTDEQREKLLEALSGALDQTLLDEEETNSAET